MKKNSIIYTYPNTLKSRDSLKNRYLKLLKINEELGSPIFENVEVPANFIKTKKEMEDTSLPMYSLLNDKTVKAIYKKDKLTQQIKYILHTEPVFNKKANLHWYNSSWLNRFFKHIFSIIDFYGITPYAIEIHPGE